MTRLALWSSLGIIIFHDGILRVHATERLDCVRNPDPLPGSSFDALQSLTVRAAGAKGLGVFATVDIPNGTILGEYHGKLVAVDEAWEAAHECHKPYLFFVPGDITW